MNLLPRSTTAALLASVALLMACNDATDVPELDAGAGDAGGTDAARDDAGLVDSGTVDSGAGDAAMDTSPTDGGLGFGTAMSFFVSSTPVFDTVGSASTGDVAGDGNLIFTVPGTSPPVVLRGVEAADAHCAALAAAAGSPRPTWLAYLSTQGLPEAGASGVPGPRIDARDRTGPGPWYDATESVIADATGTPIVAATLNVSIGALLGEGRDADDPANRAAGTAYLAARPDAAQILTETGASLALNLHDIFTGSDGDGTVYDGGHTERWFESDRGTPAGTRSVWGTCNDWDWQRFGTPPGDEFAQVGHTDVPSRGFSPSWNSGHDTRDCTVRGIDSRGGAGHVYCFSSD